MAAESILNFKTTGFTRLCDGFGFVTNNLDAFEVLREFETTTVTKYCFYYSKGYNSKASAGEYVHSEAYEWI